MRMHLREGTNIILAKVSELNHRYIVQQPFDIVPRARPFALGSQDYPLVMSAEPGYYRFLASEGDRKKIQEAINVFIDLSISLVQVHLLVPKLVLQVCHPDQLLLYRTKVCRFCLFCFGATKIMANWKLGYLKITSEWYTMQQFKSPQFSSILNDFVRHHESTSGICPFLSPSTASVKIYRVELSL